MGSVYKTLILIVCDEEKLVVYFNAYFFAYYIAVMEWLGMNEFVDIT
jgi:hypothetical protein